MKKSLRCLFVFSLVLMSGCFLLSATAVLAAPAPVPNPPYAQYSGSFAYNATTNQLSIPFTLFNFIQYSNTPGDSASSASVDPFIGSKMVFGNLYNGDDTGSGQNWNFGPASGGSTGPVSFSLMKGTTTYLSGTVDNFATETSGASSAKLLAGNIHVTSIYNPNGSRYLNLIGSNDLLLNMNFSFTTGSADFKSNGSGTIQGQLAVVPEPISSVLFISGGAALAFRCYRKLKNK